ncbi:MAG: hypothetical protein S4CHLAM37_03550 [Chlamydiia bacterium]|nr:hypothetical protein [Chlamydiia bacterium]
MSKSKDATKSETQLDSLKQTDLLAGVKDHIAKAPPSSETTFTVVKRNGTIVPFKKERIFDAIEAAFREAKNVSKEETLVSELHNTIEHVTSLVLKKIKALGTKGVCLTVEGIQDIVEITLMKSGFHDVARLYIIYRDHHKALRKDSPENLKVLRREDESPVRFNPIKVASTIEKAFRSFHECEGATPHEIVEAVNVVTEKVVIDALASFQDKALHVHEIQDLIENHLMNDGYFEIAKEYILTRASLGQQTIKATKEKAAHHEKQRKFKMQMKDGSEKSITESEIKKHMKHACLNLENLVSSDELVESTILNFYDGIKEEEMDTSHVMAAKVKIEEEPAYSKVAARLLLDMVYRETVGIKTSHPKLESKHKQYFKWYIKHGINLDRLAKELLEFDLDALADAMVLPRDDNFQYLGLQTLYDRYFIHEDQRRLETPQIFWMRVSMGLCFNEENKTEKAIEFYNLLSQFHYSSATPTLFNAGTTHSQLSSCYLATVMDDLHHIFKTISDDAQLSKWAGGIGNDWTNVRATGSVIKGTNGKSQGVIPFLKVANDTAVAVNQGGKRKGAMCAYLETWHLDIEDFLELRKNTGDERRRTHDMNTANWIPDLFMKRVMANEKWTLFSPNDVPDLHDLYGAAFKKRYEEYEAMAKSGKIKLHKEVQSVDLWRKMLSMLFETGHPWITFKDPSNIRSPQDHVGVVHSSNLCVEILLNSSESETAVCNLGSINLVQHVTKDGIDEKKLEKTVTTAIRMLDNVIDTNFYPIKEAENSNLKHRPIGLGIMGFQDALYIQDISYASHEAVKFADKCHELISYYAIMASSKLAKERGSYSTYKGSKWDRGLLPIDTLKLLEEERGEELDLDKSSTLEWDKVRASIKEHGMRNSNTMAIAPTATIANILGVSASIEPAYKHLFVKSNLSGEFTVVNTYLVDKLKELNIWDAQMIDDLKYFDGCLSEIERIPDEVKRVYLTAFDIDPDWLIECGARRQKWIDMGQSLNLYLAEASGKKLDSMYKTAWKKGVKTTYYLRSLGATQVEKSTTDINKRSLQPRWMKNASPSSRVQVQREPSKPIVCNLEEGCESCQ